MRHLRPDDGHPGVPALPPTDPDVTPRRPRELPVWRWSVATDPFGEALLRGQWHFLLDEEGRAS